MPEKNKELPKLQGRLGEFVAALDSERKKIQEAGLSSGLILFAGENLGEKAGVYLYRFRVEYSSGLMDDTPCRLIISASTYDATVVSYDGLFIILASRVPINEGLGKAKLESGSTYLLEKMIERLGQKASIENHIGNLMFGDGVNRSSEPAIDYNESVIESKNESINDDQIKAVVTGLSKELSFIWGPPGTGKTQVISKILELSYYRNKTALLLSHTNVAVDNAIEKICGILQKKDLLVPGLILRLGNSELLAQRYPETMIRNHIDSIGKELFGRKKSLEDEHQIYETQLKRYQWRKSYNEFHPLLQDLIEGLEIDNDILSSDEQKLAEYREQFEKLSLSMSLCSEYFDSVNEKERLEKIVQKAQVELDTSIATLQILFQEQINLQNKLKNYDQAEILRIKLSAHASVSDLNKKLTILQSSQKIKRDGINEIELLIKGYKNEYSGYLSKGFLSKSINKKKIDNLQQTIDSKEKIIKILNSELAGLQQEIEKTKHELITVQGIEDQINLLGSNQTKSEILCALEKTTQKVSEYRKKVDENKASYSSVTSRFNECNKQTDALYEKYSYFQPNEIKRKIETVQSNIKHIENSISNIAANIYDRKKKLDDIFEILRFDGLSSENNYTYKLEHVTLRASEFDSIDGRLSNEEVDEFIKISNNDITKVDKELAEIENKISQLEKQAILRAPIIGTTLTKSYLDDTLIERKFDTVVVDEASMAPIPSLWLASYLADKHLIIVGDFKQLSPIVMSKDPMAVKWLGRDIFDHSGIKQVCENNEFEKLDNFCPLYQQYRMHIRIADIANIYYGKKLESPLADFTKLKNEQYDEYCKWYGGNQPKQAVTLINTEHLHAWATGVSISGRSSRLNHMSATLCVKLAFQMVKDLLYKPDYQNDKFQKTQVLIIAPYKPHVKRIQDIIDAEYKERGFDSDKMRLIRAGTIHSFQGSEGSVVIFDLVVDEPHSRANLFMHNNDKYDEDFDASLERLYTVAVTRAKYKLIIIGNFKFLLSKSKGSKTHELLDKLINSKWKYKPLDANELFPKLAPYIETPPLLLPEEHISIICTGNNIFDVVCKDFMEAKQSIVLYSPFMTESRVNDFLQFFKKIIVEKNIIIIVITKSLSEHANSKQNGYKKCIQLLENTGVKVLHKHNMHEKLIFVDNNILWTGSLNLLSYTGATSEIMERRNDTDITSTYMKQMQVDTIVSSVCSSVDNINRKETLCPLCMNPMHIHEGSKVGYYWKCPNCEFTRSPNQPYPHNGKISCKKCGGELSFSMRTKPIWKCTHGHWQNMQKADLKMPKMRSLIPDTIIKEVVSYFEDT